MIVLDIIIFILVLCALIVVHEFGHFIAAKLFGIRVDEFSIGFPPRLFSRTCRGTRYSFGATLVGGYVKIFGENAQASGSFSKENFAQRSRWIQELVVIAGIVMNLLFAWVLLSAVFVIGMPTASTAGGPPLKNVQLMVTDVLPNSPAQKVGIQNGDVVSAMQSADAHLDFPASAERAVRFVQAHSDQSMVVSVMRGGTQKIFVARPESGLVQNDPSRKILGVEFSDVGLLQLPVYKAPIAGARLTWDLTVMTAQGLYTFFSQLLTGRANFSEVAGPIGVTARGASAVAAGFTNLLLIAAGISINLALINLIPIPGLDGGRALIIAIEGIRGKYISEKIITRLTIVGFSLLILLMIVISYHDIFRLFH